MVRILQVVVLAGLLVGVLAAESDTLRPRVPSDELGAARALTNPVPATPSAIEQGRALYHGKGFCVSCHGREGRGITDVDPALLKGALPTDLTGKA